MKYFDFSFSSSQSTILKYGFITLIFPKNLGKI